VKRSLLFLLIAIPATVALSQSIQPQSSGIRTPSRLSVHLAPSMAFPISESASLFSPGARVAVGAEYRLLSSRAMYVSGDLGYGIDRIAGTSESISTVNATLGGGAAIDLLPWLSLTAGISGGFFYSFYPSRGVSGGNPLVGAQAGVVLLPGPFHVGFSLSGQYLWGLHMGVNATLGASYEMPEGVAARRTSPAKVEEPIPVKPTPITQEPPKKPPKEKRTPAFTLQDFSFEPVFPVFHKYYDDHTIGKAVLSNSLDQPVSDIRVGFIIKQYMDEPKDCPSPALLNPGESAPVEFFALLRPDIMEITEAAKVQATISLEYALNGRTQRQTFVQSIRILDRNAMTWEDDRRASCFVTAKDPAVLSFSKNVSSIVKGKTAGAINPNLTTAIAFHETLSLCGLSYMQDPSGYAQSSLKKKNVDFLQFPRQTLEYRAGDCDDLSLLYCALLESVGIECAFITIPGHIFMAFSTTLSPEEARKAFSRVDDLIFRSDKTWIPIEVTERRGFLQAWQTGAKEWRENLARNQANFYPLRESWDLYEPVGLPGSGKPLDLPSSDRIQARFMTELAAFIDQEIVPRVAALQDKIKKSQDKRKPTNELGLLYARYGLYDRAQREFEKILGKDDYTPALLNLGNICYLSDQKEKALDFYTRAYAKDPNNPRVLLAVSKVNHDLENYFAVKKAYGELKKLDPDLAVQYAYLDLKGEEATRAGEIGGVRGGVVWEE